MLEPICCIGYWKKRYQAHELKLNSFVYSIFVLSSDTIEFSINVAAYTFLVLCVRHKMVLYGRNKQNPKSMCKTFHVYILCPLIQ